jgi:hypothetical protein
MTDSGTTSRPGQLLIWTDVDATHEDDFNRWYDREHMAERIGITGFVWGRRYRAVSGSRPYLALYRTETLDVFESAAYQQAFRHQTAWSLTNFARMRDNLRRVGTVDHEIGAGTGGALGLVHLPKAPAAASVAAIEAKLTEALAIDGVLGGHLFTPDAKLSTPLTAKPVAPPSDSMVFVEATNEPAAAAAARTFADAIAMPDAVVSTFTLLWELRS